MQAKDERDFQKAREAILAETAPALAKTGEALEKALKTKTGVTKAMQERRAAVASRAKAIASELGPRRKLRQQKRLHALAEKAEAFSGLTMEQLEQQIHKYTAELRSARDVLASARHAMSTLHSKSKVDKWLAGASPEEKAATLKALKAGG